MRDIQKTKAQLIRELEDLRGRLADLEDFSRTQASGVPELSYRNIFENTGTAILILKENGAISLVNAEFETLFGYGREEIEGKESWNELIWPGDLERVKEYHRRRMMDPDSAPRQYEFRAIDKAGNLRDVFTTLTLFPGTKTTVASLIDITERKRMEAALQASEKRYRLLANHLTDVIWTTDLDLNFTYLSPSITRLLGYHVEEAVGLSLDDLLTSHALELAKEMLRQELLIEKGEQKDLSRSKASEFELVCKDGSTFWGETRMSFLREPDGEPVGILGVVRDITARREAEEALRLYFDSASDVIYSLSPDFTVLDVSPSVERTLGYTPQELVRRPFHELGILTPESLERAFSDVKRVLSGQRILASEYEFITKDGKRKIGEISGAPLIRHGKPAAVVSVARDVTDRKEAERALRESEARFRRLAENAQDVIFRYDLVPRRCLSFVSPAVTHITGYSPEEHTTNPDLFYSLVRPQDRPLLEEMLRGRIPPGGLLSFCLTRKDGAVLWVEERAVPIHDEAGNLLAIEGTLRDISEQKQAEEALRQATARYRALVEDIPAVTYTSTLDEIHSTLYISPQVEGLLGFTPEEWMDDPQRWITLLHPEDQERFWAEMKRRVSTGSPFQLEYRLLSREGRAVWIHDDATIVRDVAGQARYLQGVFYDITERKRAEEALRQSEARYRAVVEQSADGVFLADGESRRILECNTAFQNMLGYSADEILKLTTYDFIAADREDIDRRFQKALEEKRPQIFERQYRRKDGSIIDVWVSAHFIPYGGRDVMCVLVRDLTERKKTEQELLKASKLESVGTLAGGIAHDFNNILTSILSNISLAKSQISPQDKIFKRLSEAERASLRAKGLTQQLLTFSKGGGPVRETTSLPHLLKESAHFALSGSKVECQFSLPEDLWSADIDEGQISQAIQDLILNADQAMPQGGRIGVTAENVQLTDWDQSIVPLSEGRYVKVSVKDQGIGIPREHLSKVFDPFFTTKQGRSGLGLSTAYSIIKNHGGYLSVESDLGKGTTFTFYLPASSQEAPVENAKEEIPITGKGRVLIMDDEEGIRLSAADVLAYLGYEAALAKDGSEAIQLYQEAKESGHPFAAVIMDLTIPGGVGGQEAIQRLLELDPGAKAIVSSGYSQNPILSNFRKYGFSGVLTKPYKIQEMGQILQEVLGKEGEIGH